MKLVCINNQDRFAQSNNVRKEEIISKTSFLVLFLKKGAYKVDGAKLLQTSSHTVKSGS